MNQHVKSGLLACLLAGGLLACDKLPSMREVAGTYQDYVDIELNQIEVEKDVPMTVIVTQPTGVDMQLEVKLESNGAFPVSSFSMLCGYHPSPDDGDEHIVNGKTTLQIQNASVPLTVTGTMKKNKLDVVWAVWGEGKTWRIEYEGRK